MSIMMQKLKENLLAIDELNAQINIITSSLETEQLIATCESFDQLRKRLEEFRSELKSEIKLYEAVPRHKKSRYSGRPDFIFDLDKRIKQYTNEKKQILQRLYELSMQTRSPILICMASGPCYGVTAASKGTMWASTPMTLCGLQHCLDIKATWDDFLKNAFAPQRSNIKATWDDFLKNAFAPQRSNIKATWDD
eukprot:424350_1